MDSTACELHTEQVRLHLGVECAIPTMGRVPRCAMGVADRGYSQRQSQWLRMRDSRTSVVTPQIPSSAAATPYTRLASNCTNPLRRNRYSLTQRYCPHKPEQCSVAGLDSVFRAVIEQLRELKWQSVGGRQFQDLPLLATHVWFGCHLRAPRAVDDLVDLVTCLAERSANLPSSASLSPVESRCVQTAQATWVTRSRACQMPSNRRCSGSQPRSRENLGESSARRSRFGCFLAPSDHLVLFIENAVVQSP